MTEPTTTPPKKRIIRRKKKQLTPKQKLVKESAEQRNKTEKLVFVWQEKLFSHSKISAHTLQRAVTYLQPKTYEEIVEERAVQAWCGYPLCGESPQTEALQKYKISLSQRKVYDQSELANYCSEGCYQKSKYYMMQLSEEPVWFRDLHVIPKAHVITKEQDFKTAIQQEKKKTKQVKSSQEIRQDYVQHLLGTVPKDTQGTLQIVEKTTVAPPSTVPLDAGVYDSIEGYRIEIKKNENKPTTLVLKKKNKSEEVKDKTQPPEDPEDHDAMFETMMMLKDMDMDKQSTIEPIQDKQELTEPIQDKQEPTKKASAQQTPTKEEPKDTNVIKVTTQNPKKPIKKKKKGPELSLFGTIWTMLDHMTTKATRTYLHELQHNKQRIDIAPLLKENDLVDEAVYLRGQIFSERIFDTTLRAQLDIKENLEDDIVNVIKTFRLSDASMVALNAAQCYMLSLVLIKSLADILLEDASWKHAFESCCHAIDQSIDTVDACVRVLKIASI
ncbi:Rtr1/RPAP2 family-domain-containing protein [Gilbertella persicaria]|uniref:Rtr1/RPAP2 family-domain-containing protein n=1 Tax=Gilbertella persicaria TaxID=101096 RepID=UPI0022210C49|nr:Rtr1/RPAP2 family-domain-containing protein [Gilbertella persicaria]KAI8081944.1 Rtr1/RPAP2 family-domain-containing protein [Gilbertella persicaria]